MAKRSNIPDGARKPQYTAHESISPKANKRALFGEYGLAFLLAVVTFLVYVPSLKSGFVYDAPIEIQEGDFTSLENLSDVLTLKVLGKPIILRTRPGQLLYLMLIDAVCGMNPVGYHLCGNLLHAANAALLFIVLIRLPAAEIPALFQQHRARILLAAGAVALLFALHPLAVEPVTAISYSSDLLVCFFALSALLFLVGFHAENTPAAWLKAVLVILCTFAGVTCKESGVAICLLLVIYWFFFRRAEAKLPWVCLLGIAILVSGAFLSARFLFAPQEISDEIATYPGGSFFQALLIQPRLWIFMMGKIIYPRSLSADYTLDDIGGLPLALALPLLLGVLFLQGWLSVKSRLGAMGVALFWLGLATVSNLIPLHRMSGDRFYYLPMAGVGMQLLALLLMAVQSQKFVWAVSSVSVLVLMPCVFLTLERQEAFTNDYQLWTDTVKASPSSALAHYNLGNCFIAMGQGDQAMEQYRSALEIDPTYPETYCNLAACLVNKGDLKGAIKLYRKAVEISPDLAEARNFLGVALFKNGQVDEAIFQMQEALRLNPSLNDARQNLARVQASVKKGPDDRGPSPR